MIDCNDALYAFLSYIKCDPNGVRSAVKFSSSTNMDLVYLENLTGLSSSYSRIMAYDLHSNGYEVDDEEVLDMVNMVKLNPEVHSEIINKHQLPDLYEALETAIYAIYICTKTDQGLADFMEQEQFTPSEILSLSRESGGLALSIRENRSKKAA